MCKEDYYTTLAFTCEKCSTSSRTTALVLAIVLMGGAAVSVVFLTAYLVSVEPGEARMTRRDVKLLRSLPLQAIKILVIMWQILTEV